MGGGGGGSQPADQSQIFNTAFPALPKDTLNKVLGATGIGFDPFKQSGGSAGFGGSPAGGPTSSAPVWAPQGQGHGSKGGGSNSQATLQGQSSTYSSPVMAAAQSEKPANTGGYVNPYQSYIDKAQGKR